MTFEPLIRQFYFDCFKIEPEKNRIIYEYSTDAGHSFTHELTIEFPENIDSSALNSAVFALGMAEIPSYWKSTLAPEIVIKAGKLSAAQILFWENLFTKGLGEFFYANKIDFRGLIHIISDAHAPEITPITSAKPSAYRVLVPFGGGKDSLVTGEILKQQKNLAWHR